MSNHTGELHYVADVYRDVGLHYDTPYDCLGHWWSRATGGSLPLVRSSAGALALAGFVGGIWLAANGADQLGVWMLLVIVPAATAYAWTFAVEDAVADSLSDGYIEEVGGDPDAQPPASPPTTSGRHRHPTDARAKRGNPLRTGE